MIIRVITPPEPVVSLAEAKLHLRVDGGDDDALITALIAAATEHLDGPRGWLGRAIGVQEIEAVYPRFCGRNFLPPFPPIVEILGVTYLDGDGAEQTIDPGDYSTLGGRVYFRGGYALPALFDAPDALRVRYRAGYATEVEGNWQNDTPAPIKAAIMMHVAQLYANRESARDGSVTAVPMGYDALLSPYRIWSV